MSIALSYLLKSKQNPYCEAMVFNFIVNWNIARGNGHVLAPGLWPHHEGS